MTLRQVGITVDCADADQLAAFWERFLGYTRRFTAPGSPYVTIDRGDDGPDGPPFLTFQTVPEPKETKVRLHSISPSIAPGPMSRRWWRPEHRRSRAPRPGSGRLAYSRIRPATSSASSDPTDPTGLRPRCQVI